MRWDPAQYLRFRAARIQPVLDLVSRLVTRVPHDRMRRIIDLGCGPGNSTDVLAGQWPEARVTGLDRAPEMLIEARQSYPELEFVVSGIEEWAEASGEAFDLVFSNSALQWIPDHPGLLPHLLARVASGGALAFQVPANLTAPVCQIPRDLAALPEWRGYFPPGTIREWNAAPLSDYYDALAPHAAHIEVWETQYVGVVPTPLDILQWYLGSGLRPFLGALPDEPTRQKFCDEYFVRLVAAYPPQPDGKILFPFRRRFGIAIAR